MEELVELLSSDSARCGRRGRRKVINSVDKFKGCLLSSTGSADQGAATAIMKYAKTSLFEPRGVGLLRKSGARLHGVVWRLRYGFLAF